MLISDFLTLKRHGKFQHEVYFYYHVYASASATHVYEDIRVNNRHTIGLKILVANEPFSFRRQGNTIKHKNPQKQH